MESGTSGKKDDDMCSYDVYWRPVPQVVVGNTIDEITTRR